MSEKITAMIEEIKGLTVLELSELVHALEEEFGVSAAAMAAPAPAGTVDEVMAVQQGKKVTGVVVDGTGEPVIGANVVVKGTTNGTITDFDGNYTIEGVSANDVLVISYIGYLSQEVPVGNQSMIKVTLLSLIHI